MRHTHSRNPNHGNHNHDPRPEPEEPFTLRPLDEISKAHNMLACVINDEDLFKRVVRERDRKVVTAVSNALCWCLNHDPGDTFRQNLIDIAARALRVTMEEQEKNGEGN